MAPSKSPYDPIVSVEGMYKGSLTRLGYFFKDPKLYGEATLAVLRETAKRYDDALDDCLIQILDAKWLLEHQLAQNQSRRAREAAEIENALKKRKMETTTDGGSANPQVQQIEENSAKRVKVEHNSSDTPLQAEQNDEGSIEKPQSREPARTYNEDASAVGKSEVPTGEQSHQKAGQSVSTNPSQALLLVKEEKGKNVTGVTKDKPAPAPAPQEEPGEHNEQVELTANDEDMNFESMFGDANAGNDQSNDLNFDLDLNPDKFGGSNPFDSTAHDATNLELLPGLESYANASGDDFGLLNLPTSSTANQPGIPALGNNFDLPEIQGDSNFNDLFADGDFGGDASLMDLDLEDSFFNT